MRPFGRNGSFKPSTIQAVTAWSTAASASAPAIAGRRNELDFAASVMCVLQVRVNLTAHPQGSTVEVLLADGPFISGAPCRRLSTVRKWYNDVRMRRPS
jgi:hypothetical protein